MHIKVNRQKFLNAMRIVESTIKENKIKPILSCVYIKAKDNKLYFCGTNLENFIKTHIEVEEFISDGEIAFYYSTIEAYLKELKENTITLRVENNADLFIETDNSVTEFAVFTTEDYPNTFENIRLDNNNFKFNMSSQELIDIFEKVIFAVDTPDNIALNSLRIESILKHLHFVATNAHRLVFLKKNIGKDIDNFAINIPAEAINSIIKILKPLEDDQVNVYMENSQIYFSYKNIMIITKLIELKYPNYMNILINKDYNKKLTISTEKFYNMLRRMIIFSRTNVESKFSVTFDFENKDLNISALNDIAKINEKNEVDFVGENLKIALNVRYLLDFIQNLPKDKYIELEFKASDESVKIYEKDTEDYIYILMPLALK